MIGAVFFLHCAGAIFQSAPIVLRMRASNQDGAE